MRILCFHPILLTILGGRYYLYLIDESEAQLSVGPSSQSLEVVVLGTKLF